MAAFSIYERPCGFIKNEKSVTSSETLTVFEDLFNKPRGLIFFVVVFFIFCLFIIVINNIWSHCVDNVDSPTNNRWSNIYRGWYNRRGNTAR